MDCDGQRSGVPTRIAAMESVWLHERMKSWQRSSKLEAAFEVAYTGAMRTAWKKIRYRLEWLGLKAAAKLLPLLSRKACYPLALLLCSLRSSRSCAKEAAIAWHRAKAPLCICTGPCAAANASPCSSI